MIMIINYDNQETASTNWIICVNISMQAVRNSSNSSTNLDAHLS